MNYIAASRHNFFCIQTLHFIKASRTWKAKSLMAKEITSIYPIQNPDLFDGKHAINYAVSGGLVFLICIHFVYLIHVLTHVLYSFCIFNTKYTFCILNACRCLVYIATFCTKCTSNIEICSINI